MHLVREELHIATDAAAKAAITGLSQGVTPNTAIGQAVAYAGKNTVAGAPLRIDSSHVKLGGVTYVANGRWTFTENATPLTAATVTVIMRSGTTPGTVNLIFGRMLGTPTFSPSATSTAAFVRNKVCLCFDCSRSMTFDTTGNDASWPTSQNGYPYGVPWSAAAVTIDKKKQDLRWLYPPCHNSRWHHLTVAANAFLDALDTSVVDTQVALLTWGSDESNIETKDSNGKYYHYQEGTLKKSNSAKHYPAFKVETNNPKFTTTYLPIRSAIAAKGTVTMLGGTDMNTGLQQAVDLFAATEDGLPWNKIIILFSDGCYTVGTDPTANAAVKAAKANIVVHTVGFLLNAQDSANGEPTLKTIADVTGGQHYRATNGASLKAAFEELARTLPVILTQ
jgi:hypothetical protein